MNRFHHVASIALCGLSLGPVLAQDEAPPADPVAAPDEAAPDTAPNDPESWMRGWAGSVNAGLFGSSGNTDRVNFLGKIDGKREHSRYDTSFNLHYSMAREDSDNTENYFLAALRNDWKFGESPWIFFAKATYEYDEFQDWNSRVTFFAGPGYYFFKDDETTLLGRLGAGVSKEFGSEDDKWKPELNIGGDFSHKIDSRQTITASADFFPALDGFPEYRAEFKAEYTVLISDDNNMNLKIGVLDRYDSTPGEGIKRNDLDYYLTIGWTF